jgi:hypothetical protein
MGQGTTDRDIEHVLTGTLRASWKSLVVMGSSQFWQLDAV